MRLAILVPAFNEEKTIRQVVKSLPKRFPKIKKVEVIVVNDGSVDKTSKIVQGLPITLISHCLNRGLGGALGTGFEYAREKKFDVLVTFDADAQHNPNDIFPIILPIIKKKADVVIGSRFKSRKGNMPWYRKIGIFGLNVITYLLYWVWTSDSQSGLRAFGPEAIEKIRIRSNRMEVSSEFFHEFQSKNLKMAEVPITSIYTQHSLAKGQKNINVLRILSKMIYRRFFAK